MSFSAMTPFGSANAFTLLGYNNNGSTKVAPAVGVLTPSNGAQVVNLQALPGGNQLGAIVTLFIDNSGGAVPVTVTFPDTGQVIEAPAYSQGYYPALTAGLVFTVAAPLIGVLNGDVGYKIQVANFAIPPSSYGPFYPDENAGVLQSVGTSGGWNTFVANVPEIDGVQAIFDSLEVDSTNWGGQLALASVSIDGSPWQIQQLPLQKSEFYIPPTASGTPFTATATLPGGQATTKILPLRWRVAPIGESVTYNVPLYMPWISNTFTSMSTGATSTTVLPSVGSSDGFYVDLCSITWANWSQNFTFALADDSYGFGPIFEGSFPTGSGNYQFNAGYVAFQTNAPLSFLITNAGAATGSLSVNVRATYIQAAQYGV